MIKNDYNIVGPYNFKSNILPVKNSYRCISIIKTYKGALTLDQYVGMYQIFNKINYSDIKDIKLGEDEYYITKKKLDQNYPQYSVQITTYYNVYNLFNINQWFPHSIINSVNL